MASQGTAISPEEATDLSRIELCSVFPIHRSNLSSFRAGSGRLELKSSSHLVLKGYSLAMALGDCRAHQGNLSLPFLPRLLLFLRVLTTSLALNHAAASWPICRFRRRKDNEYLG